MKEIKRVGEEREVPRPHTEAPGDILTHPPSTHTHTHTQRERERESERERERGREGTLHWLSQLLQAKF